jgi:hypothetical protein
LQQFNKSRQKLQHAIKGIFFVSKKLMDFNKKKVFSQKKPQHRKQTTKQIRFISRQHRHKNLRQRRV